MSRMLVVSLGLLLSWPAAADTITLTDGRIYAQLQSFDFGTSYQLGAPDFALGGHAGGQDFHNVNGLIVSSPGGTVVYGADVGMSVSFFSSRPCNFGDSCPTVTLDGITYTPQMTDFDGQLDITSTATTISPTGLITTPFTAFGTLVGHDRLTRAEVFNLTLIASGVTTLQGLGGLVGPEDPGVAHYFIGSVTYTVTPVPEPGTIGLVVAGLVSGRLWWRARRVPARPR